MNRFSQGEVLFDLYFCVSVLRSFTNDSLEFGIFLQFLTKFECFPGLGEKNLSVWTWEHFCDLSPKKRPSSNVFWTWGKNLCAWTNEYFCDFFRKNDQVQADRFFPKSRKVFELSRFFERNHKNILKSKQTIFFPSSNLVVLSKEIVKIFKAQKNRL